ncbi:hypothetical protein PIB30_044319 [Stylosanthes scabra]|uniref:Uncharacterized protein n=1 Tax=Stylosanthes scabra TaxID=79078 RepID=A0ABU6YGG6_9FABA|nr:hypothetical protein [Stylosanthes scabra]
MAMETAMDPTIPVISDHQFIGNAFGVMTTVTTMQINSVMPMILLHQNLKIQRQIAPKDASVPPSSLNCESRYLLKMKTSIVGSDIDAESKGNGDRPHNCTDAVKVPEPNIPESQIVETVESVAVPETEPATVAY